MPSEEERGPGPSGPPETVPYPLPPSDAPAGVPEADRLPSWDTVTATAPGEGEPPDGTPVGLDQRGLSALLGLRWEIAFYAALIGVALAMRLWDLGADAIHHDESLHAVYSWYLYEGRGYQHNPMMHGPFQFHMNALVFFLIGDSDFTARVGYALIGATVVGLPWFLRGWLGRTGALITATLLAFSPTLLYFSRFARNDIIMALWTLAMVVVIWRYLRDARSRDLYLLSALLALAFATKETVYLSVAALGSFLFLLSLDDLKALVTGRKRLSHFGPAGGLLVVMFTLSLPMGVAIVSVVGGPLGLVLANTDPGQGGIGLPLDGGVVVAVIVSVLGLAFSAAVGALWDWRRWTICATIFFGVWILLYTTFFTNPFGVVSGVWQSLGYWLAQQDVARGGQPWYYYLVIGWNYEFLPLLVGIIGGAWYARKGDLFSRFLVYWALVTFVLFTLASEKMPWLLVHITLPFILMAGRSLGDLTETIPWRRVLRTWAPMGIVLVPVVLIFAYRLLFFSPVRFTMGSFLSLWGWLLLVSGLTALVLYLTTRVGRREGLALAGLGVVLVLFVLGVRAGWIASYRNGDVPLEMLVYTQSSPDIPRIAEEIAAITAGTGVAEKVTIVVDGDDGFAWPWVWYLRDADGVGYPGLSAAPPDPAESRGVVLVNARNESTAEERFAGRYTQVERYRHRWWFPESYKGITLTTLRRDVTDRSTWKRALDYWLFRKVGTPLGSADAYFYYSKDLSR